MNYYICENCGAKIIINAGIHFTNCMYCGSKIAIINQKLKDLNIKKMIPFTIEKEEVENFIKSEYSIGVLEAKKIYIPVRFCNYEFDYLMNYEYYVESTSSDGDIKKTYYDEEALLDGCAKSDLIFGTGKLRNVLFSDHYRIIVDEIEDFDYSKIKDVSLEYSVFNDNESLENNIENRVADFCRLEVSPSHITKIYSENHFINNIEIEDYSTLIPVYLVKTEDGNTYRIPGSRRIIKEIEKARKKIKRNSLIKLISFIFIFSCIISFIIYKVYNGIPSVDKDSRKIVLGFGIFCMISLIGMFVYGNKKRMQENNRIISKNDKIYEYKIHVVSKKRQL